MYRLTVYEEYDKNYVEDFTTLNEAKERYKNSLYFNGMPYEIIYYEVVEYKQTWF